MKPSSCIRCSAGFLALVSLTITAHSQTFFNADFSYSSTPDFSSTTDFSDLNAGMTGLVGTFSGATNSAVLSFASDETNAPPQVIDALGVDDQIAATVLTANLTSAAAFGGGLQASFFLASRRGNNNAGDDYSIVGYDAFDNEAFHLAIGTDKNGGGQTERIGVVTGGGATTTFDLTTVSGVDAIEDLDATNSVLAGGFITLTLNTDGYTIGFSSVTGGPVADSIGYLTDTIAYNGAATSLSRIEFQLAGAPGGNNANRSGIYLDDLNVSIIPEPSGLALVGGFLSFGLVAVRRRR
ncbi:MAG: hypothetical protein AAGJ81_01945 [Verrucomicrobiota bacterium]